MSISVLGQINLQNGLDVSAPQLSPESENSLSEASWNAIVSGNGHTRPFNGATGVADGSHKMFPFGNTWGGIKINGSAVGSFFQDIGKSRWGIGAGFPHIEGTSVTGWTLSTNLQLSIASSGVYGTPVQAGLAQPSAPTVGIIAGSVGDITNTISVKIERSRPSTGARSVASPTSAVIKPQSNRIRVTFPAAATGQTHWRAYFTFQGFGGNGVHYLGQYSAVSDIPEATVAAGTVDGVARSLEFNFKDGDLIPLEASFDDYPPPAATHALRLQNVLNLVGCYADSVASPTAASPGTAIAVSKENNYESYVPTSLLFLPEQVVDVMARPIDDYGYIACENSIHALQYIGPRGEELPSCTLTTILPDIGIQYAHNWCQFRGRLLLYPAPGILIMMDDNGSFETDFSAPVAKILKTFTTATTVLGYDPSTDSLVIFNGKRALIYSLQARQWRQIWLPDFSIPGSALSATTAKRTLFFTMADGGSYDAYSYDTASPTVGVSFVSNYQKSPAGAVCDIMELVAAAETSVSGDLVVVIGKNLFFKGAFRRISTTAFSGTLTDADSGFTADLNTKKAVVFGTGLGGGAVHYMIAPSLTYSSPSQVVMGGSVTAAASRSECLMLVGDFIAAKAIDQAKHLASFFPNIVEARSYQVGVWFRATGSIGNALSAEVLGNVYSGSRAL